MDEERFALLKELNDDDKKIEIIRSNNPEDTLTHSQYIELINTLSESSKIEILKDKRFLIAKSVSSEQILEVLPDEKKKEILLSNKYELRRTEMESLMTKFAIPDMIDFINENPEFFAQHEVYIHKVVTMLRKNQQQEFASRIDEIDISLGDKLKSLVVLKPEVKAEIDRTNMSQREIEALEMDLNDDFYSDNFGSLDIDLDSDLSKYKGLDELIAIKPQKVPFEKHDKLLELTELCPELHVVDNLQMSFSTGKEFANGEKWIDDVLSNIQDDWTDIQKAAYIEYRIGKKISYTPEFDSEVSDDTAARPLWKVIDSGYGVCNGISQVGQYLLEHVGIDSELINSGRHTFLKIKDIDIPKADGSFVHGDTIADPTWDLTAHRFDALPNLFAKSYEEIRKFDITRSGEDKGSHKCDEAFTNGTINMEEDALREVFKAIGIANEIGHFKIANMMQVSDKIADSDLPLKDKIAMQLELVGRFHPEFSTCQNSTMSILEGNVLNHPGKMNFEKLVVHRAYNRSDEDKKASMFVYFKDEKENEGFFVAERGSESFSYMEKDEFTKAYECYELDMQMTNGLRPWENGSKKIEKDLNKSSGVISNKDQMEGDER